MSVDPTRYPKAKYSASSPPALVANPEEEAGLGPGWFDHPDLVNSVVKEESAQVPDLLEHPEEFNKQLKDAVKPAKVKPSALGSRDAS